MKRYVILRWNKKYGSASRFIIKDNSNKKQCIYDPAKEGQATWVSIDLTQAENTKDWEAFGNESFDDISEIAFY